MKRARSAELSAGLEASSLGVFRVGNDAAADTLVADGAPIEQWFSVIRAGERRLVLFDAELTDDAFSILGKLATPSVTDILAG